jgi:hypothetical protein
MGKFLVVHPVGKDMDFEAATPVARAVKASCNADAYWIRSSYVPEEGKLYCEWEAKDADAVRGAMAEAAKALPQFLPIEGVYAVAGVVNGEDYR